MIADCLISCVYEVPLALINIHVTICKKYFVANNFGTRMAMQWMMKLLNIKI